MLIPVTIIICVLLLIAYIFDLTSSYTRVPSVILLLFLGWIVARITEFTGIVLPDLSPLLPVLGTVGLILIVLEGSLELELDHTRKKLIKKSFFVSLMPILILAFMMAFAFEYFSGASFKDCLVNAIPLAVISSSIAIPSSRNLNKQDKEFVIYESSFSDILGVLFFNFIAYNEIVSFSSFGYFGLQLLVMAAVSFIATIGLAYLLRKIDHPIKFAPIILLVILIYEISKIYHLPALIFILLFGLFLGNLDELKRFRFIEKLKPDQLNAEVHKFRDLTVEMAFLIRSLFFLIFGYLINTEQLLNADTFIWAVCITTAIFSIRALVLRLGNIPFKPLVYMAPRGLITVLLFLAINPESAIYIINNSLIIQVVILSSAFMMIGLLSVKKES